MTLKLKFLSIFLLSFSVVSAGAESALENTTGNSSSTQNRRSFIDDEKKQSLFRKMPKAETYEHWVLKIFPVFKYARKTSQIPEPFVSVQEAAVGKSNDLHLIHEGTAALYKRLEMIDRAEKSIDLEYFIFRFFKDKPKPTEPAYEVSTKLIVHHLIQKVLQGVQVRILVDQSISVFTFEPEFVYAIHERIQQLRGNPSLFQVRFYNNQVSNFRNHRKLFVIDEKEAITGGRNIEDKYFDLDFNYNFLDRDIWAQGPIVPVMKKSFDAFWNAPVTVQPDFSEGLKALDTDTLKLARDFLTFNPRDRDLEKRILSLGQKQYERSITRTCPRTTFVSDVPINSVFDRLCISDWMCKQGSYKENFRITERALGEHASVLQSSEILKIESPYLMLNTRSGLAFQNLTKRKVAIQVFTNSLGSTDAVHAASAFYREVFSWAFIGGVQSFIHQSRVHPQMEFVDEAVKFAVWGTHAKTQLFGDRGFYVGTYNIDNRSSFYNAEMGLFCDGSSELNDELRKNMDDRVRRLSAVITPDQKVLNPQGVEVDPYASTSFRKKVIMKLGTPLFELFQFLM